MSLLSVFKNFNSGKKYKMTAQSETKIPFEWELTILPNEVKHEVIFAFIILAFVYVLIVFEVSTLYWLSLYLEGSVNYQIMY